MPIQEIDTLGEVEFGGYPFGNVVFLSFDVDVDIGDELSLEFLGANNASFSNLLAIDWGDDTANSTQSTVSHTYQENGIFTVNVVAQPDFEGVTETTFEGPIDHDTLSYQKLTDLTKIVVKQLQGSPPFGLIQPRPDTVNEVFFASGGKYRTQDESSNLNSVKVSSVDTIVGPLDALPSPRYIDLSATSDNSLGQPGSSFYGGGVEELWLFGVSSETIDLDAIVNGDHPLTLIRDNVANIVGNVRSFFQWDESNHNELTRAQSLPGDGVDLSGDNVLGASCYFVLLTGTKGGADILLPTDWRRAGAANADMSLFGVAHQDTDFADNYDALAKGSGSYSDAINGDKDSTGSALSANQGLIGALESGVDLSNLGIIKMGVIAHDLYDKILAYANAPSLFFTSTPDTQPYKVLSIDLSADTVTVDDPNGNFDADYGSNPSGSDPLTEIILHNCGTTYEVEAISTTGNSYDSTAGKSTVSIDTNVADLSQKSLTSHSTIHLT